MRIVSLIPSRGSKKNAAADDGGSMFEHDDDEIFMTGGLEKKKAASAFRHTPTGDRAGDHHHGDEREPPSFSGRRRTDMDVFLPATGPVEHEKGLGRCASPPPAASMNNSKRKFPKEKWVKHTAAESDSGAQKSSFESMADYRKRCSQNNKHPIDKHITEEPRIRYHSNIEQREEIVEDDRYRSASPIRSRGSSEDGIAQWRSSEDEDDKNSGDDWDMKMEDPALAVIMVPNSGGTDSDTATVTSLEMIHFDPQRVQVLGTEHRFHPHGAVSFQSNEESLAKNKKKGSKAFWSKRLSKSRFLAQNKKETHSGKHAPSRPTKGRTMSSLSNSGSSGSFDSDDDNDDVTRESCEIEQSRAASKNRAKVSLLDEELDEEEDEDPQSDCSASSGSLSEGEQKRYRKERRAEHRRRLWKKRWELFVPTMSKHIEEEEEEEDSRCGDDNIPPTTITTPYQTPSARYSAPEQKSSQTNQKASGGLLSFLRRNESPPLPWEEDKPESSHGLFGAKKKQIRSVNDLPFPRSESLDGSLLEVRDKYRDIFEELEVLKPPPAHIQVDSQEATVESSRNTTYSAGSAKKPIRRRTQKGIGHAVRKVFLRR